MAYSKETLPDFVPEDQAEDTEMYDTDAVMTEENRAKGIKTPGWTYFREDTKSNGDVRRHSEVFVAYSGAGTRS